MKLKKWGSLLTALAMVGSMATYVPASVSAAETEQTAISGKLTDTAVSFTIDDSVTENTVLTIAPTTTGATYVVPNNFLYEVALANVSKESAEGFDTVTEVAAIEEIRITGNAKISQDAFVISKGITGSEDYTTTGEGDEAVTTLNTINVAAAAKSAVSGEASADLIKGGIRIDCYAKYDAKETSGEAKVEYSSLYFVKTQLDASTGANVDTINVEKYGVGANEIIQGIANAANIRIEHTMKGVSGSYKHVCTNNSHKTDASFSAHDFTKANATIDTKNHAHICACGKSSEDYKTEADGNVNGYKFDGIHRWNEEKHECYDCLADMYLDHEKEYEKVDETTHKIVCTGCSKSLSTDEAHDFKITVADMGDGIAKQCGTPGADPADGCGATHADDEHVYEYAWQTKSDGSFEFVKVGTATGAVCACGKIIPKHNHKVTPANTKHLCACGYTEECTNYTMLYDEDGDLISAIGAVEGVICADCGAVDATHSEENHDRTPEEGSDEPTPLGEHVEDTYCDTAKHKHYCYCGKEIISPEHDVDMDKDAHTHYCKKCLAVGVQDHDYSNTYLKMIDTESNSGATLYELKTELQATNVTAMQLVCVCGAKKEHTHSYIYGVNQEHYCACGAKEATADHEFETVTVGTEEYDICEICGYIDGHTHNFAIDNECKCTNPKCDAVGHNYVVRDGEHVCDNCGKVGNADDDSTHTYVIDPVKHTHTCACGATKDCNYVDHICECGATNHGIDPTTGEYTSVGSKTVDGVKVHYCTGILTDGSRCGYVFTEEENYGHVYDLDGDDKCTVEGCSEKNPKHKCAVDLNDSQASDNTPEVMAGNDVCRCGEKIDHVLGLPDAEYDKYHQCTNVDHVVVVNEEKGTVTIKVRDTDGTTTAIEKHRCSERAKHVFTEKINDETVTYDFCECGAMNPSLLSKNGIIKAVKNTDSGEIEYSEKHDFDEYATQYTTAFLVELKKAYVNVMKYDITGVAGHENGSKITLATSETAQADALAAIEKFNEIWDTNLNYQAASSAKVDFVIEYDEDGVETVNHATRGTAVVEAVYGKVGETVTIQVKPNAGYTFVGWYAKQTPAATDKPLATTAAMEVTIKDGQFPYYAKFKENAKKQVTFNEGIMYFSSITAAATEYDSTTEKYVLASNWKNGTKGFTEAISFLTNEEIIIKADEEYFNDADKDVAGVTDKYGNLVENNVCIVEDTDDEGNYVVTIDEDAEPAAYNAYRFTLAYENSFAVSTYSNNTSDLGDDYYVQFQVGGKIVSAKKLTSSDATSIKPVDPEKIGSKFIGWYYTDNADDPANNIEELKTLSQQIGVLVPYFEKIDDLTVEIKNGTIDKDSVKDAYTYGDKILVTADLQNAAGKYFSGWYDANGNLLSLKRTDYIIVKDNMVITAKYDRTEELVLEASLDLTATRTETALVLSSTRNLTDDMTFVEVGMLYGTGEIAEADLNVDNTSLRRKVKTASETGKNGTHDVTITFSAASKNAVVSAIAYYIYQDAEGNNHIKYSAPVYSNPVE